MPELLIGIFFILHGLVHLLYIGQSRRVFELKPGFTWPDGSWALSRLLRDETVRVLASLACAFVAAGFVAGGIGFLAELAWWRPVILVSALFSTLVYILTWNGRLNRLDQQGAIGVLINLAILGGLIYYS